MVKFVSPVKKDGSVYAIYLLDENEKLPAVISFKGLTPAQGTRLQVLGTTNKLVWKTTDAGVAIQVPESIRQKGFQHAVAIKIANVEKL
jgi:alpha-L-fucosidase